MLPSVMLTRPDVVTLKVSELRARTRTMYDCYLYKQHIITQIRHIVDYIKQDDSCVNQI